MYESFFGFHKRPFVFTPHAETYFPAGTMESARLTLVRCIERGAGPGLLIGPAGMGKTLLCEVLAEHFRDSFAVAMLASGRLCSRRALLQAILFELGLPYRNMEEGELRLSLIDHVSPGETSSQGLLLLVDEAHTLPLRLLEEIRMITNLVRDGQPRVRVVLAGGPVLEERFASPKLDSFNQRVVARCYLDALNRDETDGYVRAQIAAVGGHADSIFDSDALRAIYSATDGIPRLVNQVADHALMMAAIGEKQQIGAAGIDEAWADLQQLPTPWNGAEHAGEAEAGTGVVEFGGLDDEDGEPIETGTPDPETTTFDDATVDRTEPFGETNDLTVKADNEVDSRPEPAEADEDEPFEPAGTIGPEVELVFHGAHDPFGEDFDEEEIVTDEYLSLDDDAPDKLRVASQQESDIGTMPGETPHEASRPELAVVREPSAAAMVPEQIEATTDEPYQDEADACGAQPHVGDAQDEESPPPAFVDAREETEPDAEPVAQQTLTTASLPSDDPVMPESSPAIVASAEPLRGMVEPMRTEATTGYVEEPDVGLADDRDIIVVRDDSEPKVASMDEQPVKRPRCDYRRLFANLRQQQA